VDLAAIIDRMRHVNRAEQATAADPQGDPAFFGEPSTVLKRALHGSGMNGGGWAGRDQKSAAVPAFDEEPRRARRFGDATYRPIRD
jgi:hypothetical protein